MTRPRRIIRLPEVEHRTGLRKSSIYVKMAKGRFPKSVRLGERAVGWFEDDIDAWIFERERA